MTPACLGVRSVPSSAPVLVSTKNVSSSSIEVVWQRPLEANGEITEYTLTLFGPGGSNVTHTPGTSFTLHSLLPYTAYNLSVTAATRKGAGPQLLLQLHTDEGGEWQRRTKVFPFVFPSITFKDCIYILIIYLLLVHLVLCSRSNVSSSESHHIQPHRCLSVAELGASSGAQWTGDTVRLQGPGPHNTRRHTQGTVNFTPRKLLHNNNRHTHTHRHTATHLSLTQ